jgi:hypothetical protein
MPQPWLCAVSTGFAKRVDHRGISDRDRIRIDAVRPVPLRIDGMSRERRADVPVIGGRQSGAPVFTSCKEPFSWTGVARRRLMLIIRTENNVSFQEGNAQIHITAAYSPQYWITFH